MNWNYHATLPAGFVKRELDINPQTITFGDKSIAVSQIIGAEASIVKQYTNGIPTQTTYNFKLQSPDGKLKAGWSVGSLNNKQKKATAEEASQALLAFLSENVGPRIAHQIAQSSDTFGPYTFSPEGIVSKGLFGNKAVPWHLIQGCTMQAGQISPIYLDDKGNGKQLGGMALSTTNAMFLPQIVDAYAVRFGVKN